MSENIENIRKLDGNQLVEAFNTKQITVDDISTLVNMFPSEFLASLAVASQGIKASIDNASSAQMENLKGTTVTQMQIINSVTDSLRTIEETIRLLATQAQSDSFREQAISVLLKLADYKLKINEILKDINDANNQNRLAMTQENNNFFLQVIGSLGMIVTLAAFIISGGKTPPPKV